MNHSSIQIQIECFFYYVGSNTEREKNVRQIDIKRTSKEKDLAEKKRDFIRLAFVYVCVSFVIIFIHVTMNSPFLYFQFPIKRSNIILLNDSNAQ